MQWTSAAKKAGLPLNWQAGKEAGIIFITGLEQPFQYGGQDLLPGQFNAFHCYDNSYLGETVPSGKSNPLLIHCDKEELFVWAALCPRLASFLQGNDPLLITPIFMSLDMQGLVKSLLAFKGDDALAVIHGEGILRQWLSLLCIQLNLINDLPALPAHAIAAAMEAKRIIIADFEIMPTVELLAKKVGLTKAGLQAAFKHLFGTTVALYSRQARLEEAHRILSTTTYPLRVVCLMVGYPDASNFSVAFKNQYGYWPGKIQQQAGNL